jgi:DNA-binding response OmpR family regulator
MATILVIDDERLLCDLLQEVLRRHGHEVFTAYSGREGVAAYRRQCPRFTLLDLHLPDMSGIEVLRQIRERDPKAAVMILTGAASDKLEREAREMGITDFLIKGLALDVLVGAVERAMNEPVSPTDARPVLPEGRLILVVDDEPQIRNLLTTFLTQKNYRVHAAHDGPSALALAEREKPDFIVLDINMPGMNGVEVLRRLQAKRYEGGVMMLTGSYDETLLKEALNLGSVDILGKPVDLERVALAIQVGLILNRRARGKAGARRAPAG